MGGNSRCLANAAQLGRNSTAQPNGDTDMADWGEAVEVAQPRSKPEKPAEAMAEPANANAKPAAAAGWRRF